MLAVHLVVPLALLLVACAGSTDPSAAPAAPPTSPDALTPDPVPSQAAAGVEAPAAPPADIPSPPPMTNVYSLSTKSLQGKPVDLSSYQGKVALIVNVASECGYTPQYAGLQRLHTELAPRGFVVLGFPSNEFGQQEPGSAEQIQSFCTTKYSVTFPLFEKCNTKPGGGQSPVYAALSQATGETPNWNFCKYLVGKDGKPIAFFPSKVAPDSKQLREAIEAALR